MKKPGWQKDACDHIRKVFKGPFTISKPSCDTPWYDVRSPEGRSLWFTGVSGNSKDRRKRVRQMLRWLNGKQGES